MRNDSQETRLCISDDSSVAMLQAVALAIIQSRLENPKNNPVLEKARADGTLTNSIFRFCVCVLAGAEWRPDPEHPKLFLTIGAMCKALQGIAVSFLGLTPPYTEEEIADIFFQTRKLLVSKSDTTQLGLALGALVSGERERLMENVYWSLNLMRSFEMITVPIALEVT